ncbi:MAG: ABC transporter permease [Lachnospiraceae bacterium]|nr:ABC transporter permease [Lachnospiraceae bacterium]
MYLAIDLSLYITAIKETFFMTFVSSFISYVIGIPLGVLLYMTDKDGLTPNTPIYNALSLIVNIFRSIPFLILLILILPVTRVLVGTTIGARAVIPPLVFSASPYIARMVESSLKEVDLGVIEAAKSMGATNFQIITKVLLSESKPSLLIGAAITITTILGYSAMAGAVGGGGLGDVAIRYGYYRYNQEIMIITVVLLVIIVQLIQEVFMGMARKSDKRL